MSEEKTIVQELNAESEKEQAETTAAANTSGRDSSSKNFDWQQTERPRKVMFAGDDIPFAWKNPLNIKSKRYSAIRKALREINNPKN